MTIKICLMMALLGAAFAQYGIPSNLVGTTNYQTADQTRQEVYDQEGNVQGEYSYLDPNGQTISVKYTAGKGGYQVLPQYQPHPEAQHQYQPQLEAQHQYQPQLEAQHQYQPHLEAQHQYPPQQLFTPAIHPYPAATAGQIKNMQEFLLEEEQENEEATTLPDFPNFAHSNPRTHVSVSHSGTQQSYKYEINL